MHTLVCLTASEIAASNFKPNSAFFYKQVSAHGINRAISYEAWEGAMLLSYYNPETPCGAKYAFETLGM